MAIDRGKSTTSEKLTEDNIDVTNKTEETNGQPDETEYPHGVKLVAITVSLLSSLFLVALDRLVIATATPKITDEFHSVDDIGWYASAYQLTACSFQLLFGKIYTFYSIKGTFLTSAFLFLVGSAICGAAPTSTALIVGRAIAGIGSAGILSGILVVFSYAVPLHRRPMFQGMFGATFAISSVVGPPLGGAFTDRVSWRWCFYINLPLGAVVVALVYFLLHIPDRAETKASNREKLSQLDFVGTAFLIPGTVCLLLALQWGGQQYPWSDGRIIALLVLTGVLLSSFVAVQIFMPRTATVPPRIITQRSVFAGCCAVFCIGSHSLIFIYFLTIYFQVVEGVSAVDSGIRLLPLILSMVVAMILTGGLTSRIGYYTPFLIGGVCVSTVGAGLLTTLHVDEPQAKWVGYQFLYGWGLGMTFQAPNLAAQTVLAQVDVPIGVSLMSFFQLLGGAIFVSVGQNVMNSQLISDLTGVAGLDAASIVNSGATSLTTVAPKARGIIISAYNDALHWVFVLGLVLSSATLIGAVLMEWRSVKRDVQPKAAMGEDGKAEEGSLQGEDTKTAASTEEHADCKEKDTQ